MTSKSAKKVVIINDIKSEVIEQAIFILRSDDGKEKVCMAVSRENEFIVKEAQEIINNYIRQVDRVSGQVKRLDKKTRAEEKKSAVRKKLMRVLISSGALIVTISGVVLCMQLMNMIFK